MRRYPGLNPFLSDSDEKQEPDAQLESSSDVTSLPGIKSDAGNLDFDVGEARGILVLDEFSETAELLNPVLLQMAFARTVSLLPTFSGASTTTLGPILLPDFTTTRLERLPLFMGSIGGFESLSNLEGC
jgi:hypothetical protein